MTHCRKQQQHQPPPLPIILSSDDDNEVTNEKKSSTIITLGKQWQQHEQIANDMDWSSEAGPMKLDQQQQQQPSSSSLSSNAPYPSTYNIIDLRTPLKSSSTSTASTITKGYVPRTINIHNQARLSILPMFPTPMYDDHPHLLLANVPIESLSKEQLDRREQGLHRPSCTLTIHNQSIPSSMRDYYEMNFQPLIDRLNIDCTILDYNYTRLDHCLKLFTDERIHRLRQTPYEVRLLDEEKPMAMEFFLQMDVDLFYMKTFSGRSVQPSQTNKGLFCMIEPESRFIMKPCGHQKCGVCSLSNHITRRPQSSVDFERNGRYRFLNDYETILNTPVMCNTSGIIYVLKCPCGQYEYVGESSNNLQYTLDRHRSNGNRIMHYFLLGEKKQENLNEMSRKSGMHLYQHSARCPTVMQMFLNCYPHYWIFVPISSPIAQRQNATYMPSKLIPVTTTTTTPEIRNDRDIRQCLHNVPLPPRDYQFSEQQRDAQAQFFKDKKDQQLPDLRLDLYNAFIIAVLPEKTSSVLRQFIASLFITHGETKLNSIGNLLADSNTIPPFPTGSFRGDWCHTLTHRPPLPISSTIKAEPTAAAAARGPPKS